MNESDPASEYLVVMRQDVYRQLAMKMLGNMMDRNFDKREIATIEQNAALTRGHLQAIVRSATASENYELAGAIRDIMKERKSNIDVILQDGSARGTSGRSFG